MLIKLIFVFLIISNALCLVLNIRSRIIVWISFFAILFVFSGNNLNADYVGYKKAYDKMEYEEFEYGYELFCTILKKMGLTYQSVSALSEFISLSALFIILKVIKADFHVFICVFLCFEQFIGIVQIRAFMASALLCVAIYNLTKGRKVRAVAWSIVSALFHRTCYFYIPFIFIALMGNMGRRARAYEKVYICLIIGAFFTMGLINLIMSGEMSQVLLYSVLRILSTEEKALVYSSDVTRWGSLIYFLYYLFNVLMIGLIRRWEQKLSSSEDGFDMIVWNINLYGGLVVPFLVFSTVYYRIFRFLNILNYVYASKVISNMPMNKPMYIEKTNAKMMAVMMMNGFLWCVLHIAYQPMVFTMVFENNVFIK